VLCRTKNENEKNMNQPAVSSSSTTRTAENIKRIIHFLIALRCLGLLQREETTRGPLRNRISHSCYRGFGPELWQWCEDPGVGVAQEVQIIAIIMLLLCYWIRRWWRNVYRPAWDSQFTSIRTCSMYRYSAYRERNLICHLGVARPASFVRIKGCESRLFGNVYYVHVVLCV